MAHSPFAEFSKLFCPALPLLPDHRSQSVPGRFPSGSRAWSFHACGGLRPRRVQVMLALAYLSVLTHLTVTPLRFASTSRPSRCEEDLLLADDPARHTIKRRVDTIEAPLRKFGIGVSRLLRHHGCFFGGLLRGFLRFLCHLPFPPHVRCPARSAYRLQSCARNISIRARTPSVKKISRFSSIFRIISEERWRRRRRSSRRAPGPSGPRGAHGLRCYGSRPYGRRAANRSGCIDCGLLR